MTTQPSDRSFRHVVAFRDRRFDKSQLPADLRRVCGHLEAKFGEEYALLFVFSVQTAVELHRAWHMTLLTSKILQQIKDRYQLRMTWNLGVVRLKFRVEDGGYELHRKVPYDYDSEYQDLYTKIAVALVEGRVGVHEALILQAETRRGGHTAKSGEFLRDFPGRLILYPLEAATCAVIFFGGGAADGGVAALCGLAAGLVDYVLGCLGGEARILVDVLVGVSTGVIGGLFYRYSGQGYCLSAIFLGTLYWFFYGTAFVIGLLEIIAGELETGVTRFIAVSVKTFVLCLGAGLGMLLVLESSQRDHTGSAWESSQRDHTGSAWVEQADNCDIIDLDKQWWRIPLYLLCSASALGQYRFPIVNYWRGLVVQLVAYEVQHQVFLHTNTMSDNLDTAASNVAGAMAGVVSACSLSYIVDHLRNYYYARLLHRDHGKTSKWGDRVYNCMACFVRFYHCLRLGRKSDLVALRMEKKLKQQRSELRSPDHPRTEIVLEPEEESLLLQTIVNAENLNVWALLMPAVYQLVPGSMIAKLWFSSIFPPADEEQSLSNVFSNLMVISTSLAVGLILGFATVQGLERILCCCCEFGDKQRKRRERERHAGMYTAPIVPEDDPVSDGVDDELVETVPEDEQRKVTLRVAASARNVADPDDGADDDLPETVPEDEQRKVTLRAAASARNVAERANSKTTVGRSFLQFNHTI